MDKAPPSAYWDNVRLKLEEAEDEAIEAQYCLEEALKSKGEADVHFQKASD